MNKVLGILIILTQLFIASSASALDAPHNAALSIGCTDCHDLRAGGPYSDDQCLSCHTNATGGGYTKNSSPKVTTHSSANTSDKYGTWSSTCISCHTNHTQDQAYAYGLESYLVTGTISSVVDNGDNTTTFGYFNLVENITEWGDYTKWGNKSTGNASAGNERGLILFANTANLDVSFEMLSATPTTMTVKGSINAAFPGAVVPGNTFAIVYGQLMKSSLISAGSVTQNVRFYQNSAMKSFAYNDASTPGASDPSPDGICQVCHTRTSFWRYDGALTDHYSGINCTQCHRHEEGFKAGCDICHNSPPATGTHVIHAGSAIPNYGSTKIQSTPSSYGFGCGICHTGTHLNTSTDPRTVQVVFAGVATQDGATSAAYSAAPSSVDNPGKGYTFNYSDGTCSNVYCHGNYPGSGRNATVNFNTGTALCGSCHGASNTDYPNSGTHYLHAGAIGSGYNYSCTLCHSNTVVGSGPGSYTISDKSRHADGFINWQFDASDPRVSQASLYSIASGSAMPSNGYNPRYYGTCSNIYCHSIAQTSTGGPLTGAPGEYVTTPTWDSPSGSTTCGSCHKNGSGHNNGSPAAMDSGSHTTHLGYTFNTVNNRYAGSYKCAICHRYESQSAGSYNSCDACHTTNAVYERHANRTVNVAFDTAFGTATYNDTSGAPGAPGNGYFSCSNTYCHSNGTSAATLVVPGNVSPVWGSGTMACNTCHGSPPGYLSGSPKANSHGAHSGETCNICHIDTTTNGTTIADKTKHVNKAYNVRADAASGVSFAYTFGSTGGSCSSISCHGGGSAQWGSELTCQSCHLGTVDVDDFAAFFYNNGVTAKLANTGEWNTTGHGRPAASGNYPSGNPAADLIAANACQYCHDDSVAHKTAANPFRLKNNSDPTWGMNGVCQSCHADASSGITVDAALRNGSKKIGSTHYGNKHNAGVNGGQFCWDCHDPHGDSNIFMVHAAVAKTSDMITSAPVSTATTSFVTFATGVGYAKSSAPFDGICNVCHTSTNHYTAISGDGHNASTRCTTCHKHSGDTRTNAFGGAGCDACHGNPPVDNQTLVGFVSPSSTGSTTAGAHQAHVTNLQIGCDSCHVSSVGSGLQHNNGDLTVTMGFSLFSGAYIGGSYNGQTTVQYNASVPSTTVSSGGLKQCSNIYCHGSTMAPNGGTNTTPVWDNSSTAVCGTCHGATTANPPTRGAHFRHSGPVTDVGHAYTCSLCHRDPSSDPSLHVNNSSEVQFSGDPKVAGATYAGTPAMLDAYGNCSNVYCHSNVQTSPPGGPLTYKSVNWNDRFAADPSCNACHEGPTDHYSVPLTGNTTGSHTKHAAGNIYCSTCHANNINEDPSPGSAGWGCMTCHTATGPNEKHGDHAINVNIVTIYGGAYSGTPTPGDAYGNCSTTYCHSNGVSVRSGTVPPNASATWGSGTLACNACHGNNTYASPNNAMPAYASGAPKENSHVEHVINNTIACANCHAGTTTTGTSIATAALHANKKYDMQSSGTYAGTAIGFTYSPATTTTAGSCSSISCHGGNTAAWGDKLTCSGCHAGATDVDDYTFGNGTVALVNTAQWPTTGHGRSVASGPYVSGNAAADFTIVNACQYCHDSTATHNAGSNPFRLRGITNATWGLNGVCQNCHAAGSTGITIDGALKNGIKKVGSLHYGAKHNALANGGQFCWDCHDAHGDANAYMIHDAVAKTSDPATGAPTSQVATVFNLSTPVIGADYAKSTSPFNGICNVCHTSTSHYTATSGDGHNSDMRCTSCHSHTGDTTTDAFRPTGGDCNSCHDYDVDPVTQDWGKSPKAIEGWGAHPVHISHLETVNSVVLSASTDTFGGEAFTLVCGVCHTRSSANHAMGGTPNTRTIDFGGSLAYQFSTSGTPTYNGVTGVSSGTTPKTCSNISCHFQASPVWEGL